MKWIPSAFSSDRIRVTALDLLKLIIGLPIRDSSVIIQAYRMPKQRKGIDE